MTIVAWDGRTIAADKRATMGTAICTVTKLRKIKRPDHIPEVLAWTGEQDSGLMVAEWYATAGGDPAAWPKSQEVEDRWSRLLVADRYGVKEYNRLPVAFKIQEPFMAWGCGMNAARAAMACGKSAFDAVEITCRFDGGCGNGIDVFDLFDL